jgi:4-amino-4-deoxy-L-arabinose transferase-like glycosyltransferase
MSDTNEHSFSAGTDRASAGAGAEAPRGWTHYLLVAGLAALIAFWRLDAETLAGHEAHVALTARSIVDANQWLLVGDRPWEVLPHTTCDYALWSWAVQAQSYQMLPGAAHYEMLYLLAATAPRYDVPPNTTLDRWVIPVENTRPRLEKTPLPYWLVAMVSRTGAGVTPWTARLPSVLAAILCTVVLLAMGRRMLSARAALLGVVIFVTSFCFQRWGRSGRPEMLLCLWMTVAMGCFYLGLEAKGRSARAAWMAAFWLSMGLANLSKQFAPLLLFWPLAAYLFWRQGVVEHGDGRAMRALRILMIAGAAGLAAYYAIMLIPLAWWSLLGLDKGTGAYASMAVCLGGPVAWLCVRHRGWRQMVPLLAMAVPGLLVMLAMFVPWMLYMREIFGDLAGGIFSSQVTQRAAGTGRWPMDLPGIYVLGILTYTLPWLALLPGGLAVGLMRRFQEHRRPLVYLMLWCLGLILLLTAAAGKREHYILPAMPALCLLMGFVAEDVFFNHRWIKPGLARWVGGGYAMVVSGGLVALSILWIARPENPSWTVLMGIAAVGLGPMAAAGLLAASGRFRAVVGLIATSVVIVYLVHTAVVEKSNEDAPTRAYATTASGMVPPTDSVFHWGDPQLNATFYFGRNLPGARWPFDRIASRLGRQEGERLLNRWLDDGRAPWISGYSFDQTVLSKHGYRPVLRVPGLGKKRLMYTLYRRDPLPTKLIPARMFQQPMVPFEPGPGPQPVAPEEP